MNILMLLFWFSSNRDECWWMVCYCLTVTEIKGQWFDVELDVNKCVAISKTWHHGGKFTCTKTSSSCCRGRIILTSTELLKLWSQKMRWFIRQTSDLQEVWKWQQILKNTHKCPRSWLNTFILHFPFKSVSQAACFLHYTHTNIYTRTHTLSLSHTHTHAHTQKQPSWPIRPAVKTDPLRYKQPFSCAEGIWQECESRCVRFNVGWGRLLGGKRLKQALKHTANNCACVCV